MKGFLERRCGSILIGYVEPPPRPFAGLSPHRVSLALRAAQTLNDKLMSITEYCRTIVRGCVDPREVSDIVPGLSGFLKRAQDYISSPGDVALMSEPQPISGKRIQWEFHVVRRGLDTGGHRYCSRVFGAVEIRRIHESGMGPCATETSPIGGPLSA